MLKRSLNDYLGYERNYPGFIEMVVRYEIAVLPLCPECGSDDTATVSRGIVSRSIHLMSATTKFRLHPNPPGKFYCYACDDYFTSEDCANPKWWDALSDSKEV
jgi:hypothetical protein